MEDKIQWIVRLRNEWEVKGRKTKLVNYLVVFKVTRRQYYGELEKQDREYKRIVINKNKIKICQAYFTKNFINSSKGSVKLAITINENSSKLKMSKYKIDKLKHLISNYPEIYGTDDKTGDPFDLTPLYQKRRIKKANLSRSNKKNRSVAACIFKLKSASAVLALITDWTDINEIYFGFPIRILPVHTLFNNEPKLLTITISSKYTAAETKIGLTKSLKMIKTEQIEKLYFHTDWGTHFMNETIDQILQDCGAIRSNTTNSMVFKYYSEYINGLIKNEVIYNNVWSKSNGIANLNKFIALLRDWAYDFNVNRTWNGKWLLNSSKNSHLYNTYKNTNIVIPEIIIINVNKDNAH